MSLKTITNRASGYAFRVARPWEIIGVTRLRQSALSAIPLNNLLHR